MLMFRKLSSLALRQMAGDRAKDLLLLVENHLTDHSQRLTTALTQANERAWKTLEIALGGMRLWDRLASAEEFRSNDSRGFRVAAAQPTRSIPHRTLDRPSICPDRHLIIRANEDSVFPVLVAFAKARGRPPGATHLLSTRPWSINAGST